MTKKLGRLTLLLPFLISAFCMLLLVPTLLKPSFKSEIVFRSPALGDVQRRTLLNGVRSVENVPGILQLDAEYITTGVGLPSMQFSASTDLLPWEQDAIKITVISKSDDPAFIQNSVADVLKKLYAKIFSEMPVSEESRVRLKQTLDILTERKAIYSKALTMLEKGERLSAEDAGKMRFLLGQTKAVRSNLLHQDLTIIEKSIKDIQKIRSGDLKLEEGEIKYMEGSFQIYKYGPHYKEFFIYGLILVIGSLIFIADRKYRSKI